MPNYRGVPINILWGAGFANTLTLGYPLDAAVAYSLPREGSEWVQASSGVEDAWITGHDQYLRGIVRWIPREDRLTPEGRLATGWDGPNGWRAFLEWARAKNPFRVVRDWPNLLRNPGFEEGSAHWTFNANAKSLSDPALAYSGSGYLDLTMANGSTVAPYQGANLIAVQPGDIVTIGTMARIVSGTGNARLYYRRYDGQRVYLSAAAAGGYSGTEWGLLEATPTIAPGTAYIAGGVALYSLSGSQVATARFDDVYLKIAPAGDAPLTMYLVEPMQDEPALERDYSRRLELVVRTVDGSPVEGY
jgi:hypothetical protein